MPEIDKAADGAEESPAGHESSAVEESPHALGDELELEVIEGLAEEEHATQDRPAL